MKNIKRTATRFGFIAAMLFALVSSVAPVSATGGTIGGSGTVAGTTSSTVSGSVSFGSIVNDGNPKPNQSASTSTSNINVIDTTAASTTGWSITAAASQFTDGATTPHLLTADALKVTNVTGAAASGTTPTTVLSNTVTYGSGINLAGAGAPIYTTDTNTGKGNFNLSPVFTLSLVGNEYPAAYTSTVTITFTAAT